MRSSDEDIQAFMAKVSASPRPPLLHSAYVSPAVHQKNSNQNERGPYLFLLLVVSVVIFIIGACVHVATRCPYGHPYAGPLGNDGTCYAQPTHADSVKMAAMEYRIYADSATRAYRDGMRAAAYRYEHGPQ